jgi:hypothetical protein
MQIVMIPAPGDTPTFVQVEGGEVTVNGTRFDLAALPASGPVRVEDDVALVEYAKDGALAATQIGEAHELRIVPVPEDEKLRADPPPEAPGPAPDWQALALLAERQSMACARWQLIVSLGPDAWQSVTDFCAGACGTWAMQQSVASFDTIGRFCELTDLLAYALALDETAVDDVFRRAMALKL